MQKPRSQKLGIGFLILWCVFWAAGMMIVAYGLVLAVSDGAALPAALMGVWLLAAAFGLYKAIQGLKRIALEGREPRRKPVRDSSWRDDMTSPPESGTDNPPDPPTVRRNR